MNLFMTYLNLFDILSDNYYMFIILFTLIYAQKLADP